MITDKVGGSSAKPEVSKQSKEKRLKHKVSGYKSQSKRWSIAGCRLLLRTLNGWVLTVWLSSFAVTLLQRWCLPNQLLLVDHKLAGSGILIEQWVLTLLEILLVWMTQKSLNFPQKLLKIYGTMLMYLRGFIWMVTPQNFIHRLKSEIQNG